MVARRLDAHARRTPRRQRSFSNAIYALDTNPPTALTLIAGGNGVGYVEGIPSQSKFNQPHGVAASSDGHIVVADTANNRVRVLDPLGNATPIYGTYSNYWHANDCHNGSYPGWYDGPGGSVESSSSAEGRQPVSVTLSPSGTLYVTELTFNLLRQVTGTGLLGVTSNTIPTNGFSLPPPPSFSPNSGYFPNPQVITVTSAVPGVLYTTNGSIPNAGSMVLAMQFVSTNVILNQGYYVTNLTWSNANADLSALRFIATNGSGSSLVASGIGITIPAPVFGPNSGYFATNQTITVTSLVPTIYYTTDGSAPTTNSTKLSLTNYVQTNSTPNLGYFYGSFAWSNVQADLSSLQIIAALTTGTSAVASGGPFTIPPPTFSPNSGYFPDCVTITVTSAVQTVYYTTDGSTPTTNSIVIPTTFVPTNGVQGYFTGSFLWCDTVHDLSSLRIASALGGNIGAFAAGASPTVNQIGFARRSVAGIGSTAVIPIVVNLTANAVLRSVQFLIEIKPEAGNPNPTAPFVLQPIGNNDFLQLTGPAPGNAPVAFQTFSYTTESNGQGMIISSPGDSSALSIQNFAVICLLAVPIPPTTHEGQSYTLDVLYPSGTSNGIGGVLNLTNMPTQRLVISNRVYFVGDSAPANGYNAGEFGNGALDNADVNNAFYASVNIRPPFSFSDAYNAMDVYPEFTGLTGDGFITYLDWQTILQRSLGVDTNDWVRFWSEGGVLENSNVVWRPNGPPVKLNLPRSAPGTEWLREAVVSARSVTTPFGQCSMPVYVNVQPGSSLSGLQFRAIVAPNGSAPAPGVAWFTPAPGVPAPLQLTGLSPSDLVCGWSLGAFPAGLRGSNYLGTLNYSIPGSAHIGQSYSVHFVGVDGAPNLSTFYQMESFPATAMIGAPVPPATSKTSDEWKIFFFGSVTNSLAADDVDADGDGLSNYQEYLAGTNPTNALSRLQFSSSGFTANATRAVKFSWLTAPNKTYVLETRAALGAGNWAAVSAYLGDGNVFSATITNYSGSPRFYRLRLQP